MLPLSISPLGLTRTAVTAMLTGLVTKAAPDAVLHGYPEYQTTIDKLDAQQRAAFARIADAIVRSHSTRRPITAVAVVGHADRALRKPVSERAAFEMEVSKARAASARQLLLARVQSLASGAHFSKVLLVVDVGVGNTLPVFKTAVNEAQMKQNRRVEIFLFQSYHSRSRCAVR